MLIYLIIGLFLFLAFVDLVLLGHNLASMFSYIFRKHKLIKKGDNYSIGFRQFFLFIPLPQYKIVKDLSPIEDKSNIIKEYRKFLLEINPKIVKLRKKVKNNNRPQKYKIKPKQKNIWQYPLF